METITPPITNHPPVDLLELRREQHAAAPSITDEKTASYADTFFAHAKTLGNATKENLSSLWSYTKEHPAQVTVIIITACIALYLLIRVVSYQKKTQKKQKQQPKPPQPVQTQVSSPSPSTTATAPAQKQALSPQPVQTQVSSPSPSTTAQVQPQQQIQAQVPTTYQPIEDDGDGNNSILGDIGSAIWNGAVNLGDAVTNIGGAAQMLKGF